MEHQRNKENALISNPRSKETQEEIPEPEQSFRINSHEVARMNTDQLVALPRAMLFGRTRSGKDSPR